MLKLNNSWLAKSFKYLTNILFITKMLQLVKCCSTKKLFLPGRLAKRESICFVNCFQQGPGFNSAKFKVFLGHNFIFNVCDTYSPNNCFWKHWKQTVAIFLWVKGRNIIAWKNMFCKLWRCAEKEHHLDDQARRKRVNYEMKKWNRMKLIKKLLVSSKN